MKISPIFNVFNRFNNFKVNRFNNNPINLMGNNAVDCFVRSNVSFEGSKRKSFNQRLDEKLNSSQDELVLFLFDELNKKAERLDIDSNIKEDLIQRKIQELLEYLASESDKDKIRKFIIASFYDFQPRKNDYLSNNKVESYDSLDENASFRTLQELYQDRKITKKEIKELFDKSDLSEKEKLYIIEKIAGRSTYKQIGEAQKRSTTAVSFDTNSALLKLKKKTVDLPQDFIQYAKSFKDKLYPNKSLDDVIDKLIDSALVINGDIEVYNKRVDDVVEAYRQYGLTRENYLEAIFRQLKILRCTSEYVQSCINGIIDNDFFKENGLTAKDYINAALRQPPLFCQDPKTIKCNIEGVTNDSFFKDNGITTKDYINTALRQPPLFYQKPKTVGEHIKIYHLIELEKLRSKNKKPNGDEIVEIVKHKNLTTGSRTLYLTLLRQKMFNSDNMPPEIKGWTQIDKKMTEYFRKLFKEEPDRKIEIEIMEHPQAEGFREFLEKFSNEISGKNHFEVKIIKKN